MVSVESRLWFIPTSPRSPYKIKNELTLLSRLDGNRWNKETQLRFADLLRESDFFEGDISQDDPAFSARDRCRPVFMLGFGYVDNRHVLHITDAGRKLINGGNESDIFFKQLLKWQFPSWQHGGKSRTANKYRNFGGIHPFLETLKVVREIGSVSKVELATFILPCITNRDFENAVSKISNFRRELARARAGRERKERSQELRLEVFRDIYREDIESGDIDTRETITNTIEGFLKKKIRTSIDYSDAVIRYFQYTNYFTRTYNGIKISPLKTSEVDRILSEMRFEIYPYSNVDNFYRYMGNPNLPQLPWENVEGIRARIVHLSTDISDMIREIRVFDPHYIPPTISPVPVSESVDILSNYYSDIDRQAFQLREELYIRRARRPEQVSDIINTFEDIRAKNVVDPALFFEWNIWRTFLSLDDCHAKPNFQIDENLMPVSNAGGNKPDMEIDYGNYSMIVEVTLTGGPRQYDTESEPVTRHLGRFQMNNVNKRAYCLFIAPEINPNTVEYFFVYFKHHPWPGNGYLTIVPLSLEKYLEFYRFCTTNSCFNRNTFYEIFNQIDNQKDAVNDNREWYTRIINTFDTWMQAQSA